MRISRLLIISLFLLMLPQFLTASTVVIDFEGLSDLEAVTTQYSGLTFSNTIALISGAAGGNLNELDFPPYSGVTVVGDDGGAITVDFANPVQSFGGYFTYAEPLTLKAFDGLDNLLSSAASQFSENFVSSGTGSPNEFIKVAFAGGISKVTVTGDPAGSSFALDNVTYTTSDVSAVPEPSTILLVLAGVPALLWTSRRRQIK